MGYSITEAGTTQNGQSPIQDFDAEPTPSLMILPISSVYTYKNTEIDWTAANIDGGNHVSIQLSRNGGANWETIAENLEIEQRRFSWFVSGPGSWNCLLKITLEENPSAFEVSDKFAIRFIPPIVFFSTVNNWRKSTQELWGQSSPSVLKYVEFINEGFFCP